jgi:hypothetical protein
MINFMQLLLVSSITITFTGCFLPNNQETETDATYSYNDEIEIADNSSKATNPGNNIGKEQYSNAQDGITFYKVYDQKTGMVSSTVPFPSSWTQLQNNANYTFQGPRNLKVSGGFGQQFTFGTNYYQGNDTPPMDINQIIQEFFMPTARQTNRTLLRTYELPNLAQKNQQFKEQLWSFAPSQKTTQAYAMEWEDNENLKYITVLLLNKQLSNYGNTWSFFGQYLQANAADYEEAKKAFIYGLENTQYNPQWIAAHNANEMNRANVSNAAHQTRMAAIQSRGNAAMELSKTYSEISDISHAGYLKRSNINSEGHSKTVNMIAENTVIANHGTGEHYTVPSGSNYYWVNNNGEYFGTNNANYDPRIDQELNQRDWTKFDVEN